MSALRQGEQTKAQGETARDTRASPRVQWSAAGRYLLDDRIEHHCRSIDISTTGVALLAPAKGQVGQKVVCYLDHFGRVEGRITRLFDEGFALAITASPAKREKLAHQIAWYAARPQAQDKRTEDRIVPRRQRVVMHLLDGQRQVAVQVLNVSRSGAAVNSPLAPTIGDRVLLGRRPASVVRVAHRLIGLQFDARVPEDEFNEAIEF